MDLPLCRFATCQWTDAGVDLSARLAPAWVETSRQHALNSLAQGDMRACVGVADRRRLPRLSCMLRSIQPTCNTEDPNAAGVSDRSPQKDCLGASPSPRKLRQVVASSTKLAACDGGQVAISGKFQRCLKSDPGSSELEIDTSPLGERLSTWTIPPEMTVRAGRTLKGTEQGRRDLFGRERGPEYLKPP